MNKEVKFHDSRKLVAQGADIATKILLETLGPAGKYVVKNEPYGGLKLTKDGASAIDGFEIKSGYDVEGKNISSYIDIGVKLIQEASSQMDTAVGDNTTTGGVLTGLMIAKVEEALSKRNINTCKLCQGIEWAKEQALIALKEITIPVTNIAHVANIAANGDEEVGRMIAEIHEKVGDAAVTVKLSNSRETSHEIVDGLEIERGYISPYFITDVSKQICELEDAYVFITDQKISSLQDIMDLLKAIAASGKSLLIIAEDVDGEALTALVVNKIKGGLKVAAIKAPSFGDKRKSILGDIAVLTGGQYFTDELGSTTENIGLHSLGRATSVRITKDKTCIVNLNADKNAINHRCNQIDGEIKNSSNNYDRDSAQERYNKLKHGAAMLYVGGDTEYFAKIRKDLVEDAVRAARAAVKFGIVPGAGASYCYISNSVWSQAQSIWLQTESKRKNTKLSMQQSSIITKDWLEGVEIFVTTLKEIQHKILLNALGDIKDVAVQENYIEQHRNGSISNLEYSNEISISNNDNKISVTANNDQFNYKNSNNITDTVISDNSQSINYNYKIGYNARTLQISNNLIDDGIIDSAYGPENAITIAASTAQKFALIGACIVDAPSTEKESAGGGMGGMGGY